MNYNFHTHTYRCRHASGTEEEYILRAIENGIEHMGFSDHIPQIFPDGYESAYRVPMADIAAYFADISALRDKYADKIDIKIGFETEYYPSHFDKMVRTAYKAGCEYLILGQHFIHEEHRPDGTAGQHSSVRTENPEDIREYADCVTAAIESGLISYVAHPDLMRYEGPADAYRREVLRICEASKKHDVPLEINFLGIRDKRFYPHNEFWEIAGEIQCPVTYGFDAHDVNSAYDGESLPKAEELTARYNLNYIGMPKLRLLKDLLS